MAAESTNSFSGTGMGGRLTHSEIKEVLRLAERNGVIEPQRRTLLLSMIPSSVQSRLDTHPSPREQALSDLIQLNASPVCISGLVPVVAGWIRQATQFVVDPADRVVLLEYCIRLTEDGIGQMERTARVTPQIEPSRFKPGELFDGRFELLDCLSESPYSVVWKALDVETQQAVAMKLHRHQVDARSGARLMRGAKHLLRQSHPNLVRVFDLKPASPGRGISYYFMEYLEGGDLHDAVCSRRLAGRDALEALLAAGDGLAASHAVEVWHRDVKPANILLGGDNRARLADFDLLDNADTASHRGHVVGTIPFAAPEALMDPTRADHRADIFGLARSAQFILFAESRSDLTARALRHAWAQVALGDIEPNLRCGSELKNILRRATRLNPADRHGSVQELLDEMRDALAEDPARLGRRFTLGRSISSHPGYVLYEARDTRVEGSASTGSVDLQVYSEDRGARIDMVFPADDWSDLIPSLFHDSVLPVRARGRSASGRYWQAIERPPVGTRSLRESLDRCREFHDDPLKVLVDYSRSIGEICHALQHLHAHAMIHGDVTADSIFIPPRPAPALLGGWALARRRDDTVAACSVRVDVQHVGALLTLVADTVDDAAMEWQASTTESGSQAAWLGLCEALRAVDACINGDSAFQIADIIAALDTARRMAHGRKALAAVESDLREAETCRSQAERSVQEALAAWDAMGWPADPQVKRAIWQREDSAKALIAHARGLEARWLKTVHRVVGDVPEARARLIDFLLARLGEADRAHDPDWVARLESQLGVYADDPRVTSALSTHRGLTVSWQQRDTTLVICQWVEQCRQRVTKPPLELTGDRRAVVELPRGDHVVIATRPDGTEGRWPIRLARAAVDSPAAALEIDDRLLDRLAADEVLVPEGLSIIGGGSEATDGIRQQHVWIDSFVMRTLPVTHGEFLEMLNSLCAGGLSDEAARFVPRGVAPTAGHLGPMLYARGVEGRYRIPVGGGLDSEFPVSNITWFAAHAFAEFVARKTGQPWRLPRELEFEKAARGVDGRLAPWGDHVDESFGNVVNSAQPLAAPVAVNTYATRYPSDVGPYGARGLGGNMRTWTSDRWRRGGPVLIDGPMGRRMADLPDTPASDHTLMVVRGAAWSTPRRSMWSANRFADPAGRHPTTAGIRLVRSIE